jgi:hypothetical protein
MKYFLFLLFFVTTFSKKFSLKFINKPIYDSIPICPFHSIVILENNNEKNDVFAIDFSPLENITSPKVVFKLLHLLTFKTPFL